MCRGSFKFSFINPRRRRRHRHRHKIFLVARTRNRSQTQTIESEIRARDKRPKRILNGLTKRKRERSGKKCHAERRKTVWEGRGGEEKEQRKWQ